MIKEIKLWHHPMFPSYAEQAKKQKLKFDTKELEILEVYRHAIAKLGISGILTDSQIDSCYKKLNKKVADSIKKANRLY